jgi:hypothetical protein
MATKFLTPGSATPRQEPDLWVSLSSDIDRDADAAALDHLTHGYAIYCQAEGAEDDVVEKRYPDGRRELVRFDLAGEHIVRELVAR